MEVVLSLGVVSFAFVGIFSLLPAGMGIFRQAMDVSIGTQIAQRIVSEVEQSDFDALVPEDGNVIDGVNLGGVENQFYALPLRYFDDQGTELGVASNNSGIPTLTATEMQRVTYTARIRGSLPGAADPSAHDNEHFTSLPASADAEYPSATRFNPRSLTFLTIQVIKNPARIGLDTLIDSGSFLISQERARERSVSVRAFPAVVVRNAYRNAN